MKHDFADGKYTVINDNGKLTALRNGEPWGRDLVGDNLVYWMLVKVNEQAEAIAQKDAELAQRQAEIEQLKKLSVTNIMLDVVPGWDGMGHEVFAKSVDDVENTLTKLDTALEDAQGDLSILKKSVAKGEVYALLADGWLPADDWTKDYFQGAVYMRQVGGPLTPFVTFDFTICKSGAQWIPIHGDVKMDPVDSPQGAARALEVYWSELPDAHKLKYVPADRQVG